MIASDYTGLNLFFQALGLLAKVLYDIEVMEIKDNFQSINQVLMAKKFKKTPAYEWQALALRVINELEIPNFKRSAVFKVCRDLSKKAIEQCLIDTKELAKPGSGRWQYFFKLTDQLLVKIKPVQDE